jgi:hypothetical protein
MHVLVAVAGGALILLMLGEFFVAFLLPRRVKTDFRLARQFYVIAWGPWRRLAGRLSPTAGDTLLGFFGPLGLIATLALWTIGLILGFAALHWANGSQLAGARHTGLGDDLYFSAGSFFSASTKLDPGDSLAKALNILEAASGFAVLFVVIGYLPALYQAFSAREVAVSQLDPRAGSPPTAGALLHRSAARGGWPALDSYLREWERWAAELMETHLSYPVLGFFRSQHVNQNWLAALTCVMDTSAFALAMGPEGAAQSAELTFALGRHALSDLAHAYRASPRDAGAGRLSDEDLGQLLTELEREGLQVAGGEPSRVRLRELTASYEAFAQGLSERLELALPRWRAADDAESNWRLSAWHTRRGRALP